MKRIITTVTQRGQVTIPAEVRRLLRVEPKDKLAFEIDKDQVRLVPIKYTVESAYGSVKPLKKPEDFKEISRAAKEAHVEKTVRKMRRQ